VNGVSVTLKTLELTDKGVTVNAFYTPPGYTFPIPPGREAIDQFEGMPFAEYSIDSVSKPASPGGIHFYPDGIGLIWSESSALNPIPADAKELTFTISNIGNWTGPWQFKIPLN
jgi:hypothetical protein